MPRNVKYDSWYRKRLGTGRGWGSSAYDIRCTIIGLQLALSVLTAISRFCRTVSSVVNFVLTLVTTLYKTAVLG